MGDPLFFSLCWDTLSEAIAEKCVTTSQASSECATAEGIVSDCAFTTSFQPFPSIPGVEDYLATDFVSTSYRTTSEPKREMEIPQSEAEASSPCSL